MRRGYLNPNRAESMCPPHVNPSGENGALHEPRAPRVESTVMNERQQSHVDYFFERIEYWRGRKRDAATARMLAARDADHSHRSGVRRAPKSSTTSAGSNGSRPRRRAARADSS
jgi:hypothetical protein